MKSRIYNLTLNKLELENRIEELESAIKKHRAQKLDDRCWLDDQELYQVLNDGNLGNNSVPPIKKMLKNCKRFLKQRCKPDSKWKSYQELELENRKSKIALDKLKNHLLKDFVI